MNRDLLEQNDIFYDEGEAGETKKPLSIPSHVIFLRGALLDFDLTIPERFGISQEEDIRDVPWEQLFRDCDAQRAERAYVEEAIERYKTIRREASFRDDGRDREAEWQTFYFQYFLDPLAKDVQVSDHDKRRTSRVKFYYDAFEWVSNRPWTLFEKDSKLRSNKRDLTAPNPDYVAYFPIYDRDTGGRTRTSHRWQWQDSPKDGLVTNFSLEVFKHLAKNGLQPSPSRIFKDNRRGRIELSDFLCYPWLIVEHKKDNSSNKAMVCYCQAANAASAALTMHQILAKYAKDKTDDTHIPPVTTMTTVGKEVKIWIAYSCDNERDHRMMCIWTGDVTNIYDVMKLEAILENLHTWAMHELRPWISEYIKQWRVEFPKHATGASGNSSDTGGEQGDTSLVHIKIEHEESLGTSSSSTTEWLDLLKSEHNELFKKLETLLKETIGNKPAPPKSHLSTAGLYGSSSLGFGRRLQSEPPEDKPRIPPTNATPFKDLSSYSSDQYQQLGTRATPHQTASESRLSVSRLNLPSRGSTTGLWTKRLLGQPSDSSFTTSDIGQKDASPPDSPPSVTARKNTDEKDPDGQRPDDKDDTRTNAESDSNEISSPSASRLERIVASNRTLETTNDSSQDRVSSSMPLEFGATEDKSGTSRSFNFSPSEVSDISFDFVPGRSQSHEPVSSDTTVSKPKGSGIIVDEASSIVKSIENDSGEAQYKYKYKTPSKARRYKAIPVRRERSYDGDEAPGTM